MSDEYQRGYAQAIEDAAKKCEEYARQKRAKLSDRDYDVALVAGEFLAVVIRALAPAPQPATPDEYRRALAAEVVVEVAQRVKQPDINGELNRVRAQLAALTAERDEAIEGRRRASELARETITRLDAEIAQLRSTRLNVITADSERDAARAELEATRRERDGARRELTRRMESLRELRKVLATAEKERDDWKRAALGHEADAEEAESALATATARVGELEAILRDGITLETEPLPDGSRLRILGVDDERAKAALAAAPRSQGEEDVPAYGSAEGDKRKGGDT